LNREGAVNSTLSRVCFSVLATLMAAMGTAHAQTQAPANGGPPAPPAPTGLVVGSGNFYSPIVADLEKAAAFYGDGIGFDMQRDVTNFDTNAPLRNMFGLPDASFHQKVGRAPPTPGGVEIVEIAKAGGQAVERRIQDPGTTMLLVAVRDIDATLERVKRLGAPVVTTGGLPVSMGGQNRAIVVRDPAGHFVQLVQPGTAPPAQPGATANVIGVRVRHTVADLEKSLAIYRDTLALAGTREVPAYTGAANVLDVLGLPHDMQYRLARLTVPTSGLPFELIEWKGARAPAKPARLADFGSTRIQLRVSSIDSAVAALTKAGGTFISTGGKPLDLPTANATLKVGIVRDPDGLFLVLIQAPPAK
jgi:catechol 2,3-dioxygenase-like lactoylglutathione lyase family enzyme